MRTVTLIAAPPGSSAAIRDVLTDLSAVGLVREFYWLDSADGAAVSGSSVVHRIRAGRRHTERMADILSDATPVAHLTLCVLITTVGGDGAIDWQSESELSDYLHEHGRATETVTRLRALIPRPGSQLPKGATAAFDSRHNIVIAPEDAYGPALGHESLRSDHPVPVARYAAPVLAALCGLWTTVDHSPLREMQAPPGRTLRVARSFYRRLDCSAVAERLRAALFDTDGRLPLPFDQMDPVRRVADVGQQNQRMAEQLWTKHQRQLVKPMQPRPAETGPRPIGGRAILRMFLSFLLASLKRVPSTWHQRYVDERAIGTARLIESVVLGRRSAYRVVVNGLTADGHTARATDYGPAAGQLAAALQDPRLGVTNGVGTSDLSTLWKDYASAAFTLCDGQERSDQLPPARVGGNRAVISDAAEVIRSPSAMFTVEPRSLADHLGVAEVSPADHATVEELARRLRHLDSDPTLKSHAAAASAELERWRGGLHRTFGVAFGAKISAELGYQLGEVRRLVKRIEDATKAATTESRIRAGGLRLFLARCVLVLSPVVLILAVVGAVREWFDLETALWVGGSAIFAFLLAAFALFWVAERDRFRLINRLREVSDTVDLDKLDLATALGNVERLGQAADQHRSWSDILGTYLADPLGRTGPPRRRPARISWGLPRTTAVGSARVQEHEVDEVAAELRTRLFGVGWLSTPWNRILAGVGDQLGPAAQDIRRRPELILSEPGAGTGSALDEWARRFSRDGVPDTGATAMWSTALHELGSGPARDRMVRDVEYFENGVARMVSVDHFRAGVGARKPAADGRFDTALFTDVAVAGWKTRTTDRPAIDFVDDELGWVAVTTQFSDGLAVDDLEIRGEVTDLGSSGTSTF
ncbi:hypothetical protein [Nocardia bovistercoris]|uniref:Uncharacterized protein n=1 Tax=Nocardia bovistercoris TaxID=2785916 RepID=A0A931IE93_9NOCA|nr:hypothetical protein [Nocardia bovistercoris]MBH0779606.1 hypothetical protein [Nocardia bovistercoris]